MLERDTEFKLADTLLCLAKGEKNIEITRQLLSENPDFDPMKLFNCIDINKTNKIEAENFINYFQSINIFATLEECKLLILFYDQDFNYALEYNEFLPIVKSEKSNYFQKLDESEKNNNELSFQEEYLFNQILKQEIELARKLLKFFADLRGKKDFNLHNFFHTLTNETYITPKSLDVFMRKCQVQYDEDDLLCITKRIDSNGDNRLNICEFHAIFGFPLCSYNCYCQMCPNCGLRCCNICLCDIIVCPKHNEVHKTVIIKADDEDPRVHRKYKSKKLQEFLDNKDRKYQTQVSGIITNRNNLNNNIENPDINNLIITQSQFNNDNNLLSTNTFSNFNNFNKTDFSNNNFYENDFTQNDRLKMRPITQRLYPLNKNNKNTLNEKFPQNEESQLISYLKTAMFIESQIEEYKIRLSLRSDFNIEDAFRIFEFEGAGYISIDDFKIGFKLLGIPPLLENDIKLLIKRFDKQKKNVINYSDFYDIITPFENNYKKIVENRKSNYVCSCRNNTVFTLETKNCLKNLFLLIIENEKQLNDMKENYRILRGKINEAFNFIDIGHKGYFGEIDLSEFLKKNFVYTNKNDCDLLFNRLDKTKAGIVELEQFEYELI